MIRVKCYRSVVSVGIQGVRIRWRQRYRIIIVFSLNPPTNHLTIIQGRRSQESRVDSVSDSLISGGSSIIHENHIFRSEHDPAIQPHFINRARSV